MTQVAVLDYRAALEPAEYCGRRGVLDQICQRLRQSSLSSSHVVGGPRAGKTSLLQYLASPLAAELFGADSCLLRAYVNAGLLGAQALPAMFWHQACRELKAALQRMAAAPDAALLGLVAELEQRARAGEITLFDLEDLCDGFGRARQPVVLFVDEFDALLQNRSFLPPSEFFDQIRGLCQRTPRGMAFVVASRRPLSESGATTFGPSPFYNHFATIPLPALDAREITEQLQARAAALGLPVPDDALTLVTDATFGHPYLVRFSIGLIIDALAAGRGLHESQLRAAIEDGDGPFVDLQRRILDSLSSTEREAVMAALAGSGITPTQRGELRRLERLALLPPGLGITL